MAGDEKSAAYSDVKSHLQNLLDAKEKQLQQAGTLGQRVLAQQMELEERIRQLQEDIGDESGGESGVSSDAMEKLKDLADTLDQWERENTALSSGFGKSSASSPSTEESTGESPKAPARPATASRRAKNAAHRADDVEFAFEISTTLRDEIHRLQSLLGERDEAIQDLKEEKEDLETSVEGLRSALKQQEQNADKSKEDNWNLEVSSQELRTELATSLANSAKLEGDVKRLTKSLATTRDAHETAQSELAKTQTSLDELRQKHETDITLAREQFAAESEGGLSEEVNRLQTLLGERDSIIQQMQEERYGLDGSVTALRTALQQMQERSEGDNWNLEESSQHSKSQTMFSRSSGFTILDGMFNNVGRDLIVRSVEYWTEGSTSCVLPPSMQLPQPGAIEVIGFDAGYGINVEPDQPVIDGHKEA
ncbi:hypothetical protein VNI00_015367 [Paramarasmius palmivorus]|uniref:Uncharacterized protein n=1 Tax=Paramarasmius palmivorus TaxID=297713 RepID=A0AAW0BMQ6_9AGAR